MAFTTTVASLPNIALVLQSLITSGSSHTSKSGICPVENGLETQDVGADRETDLEPSEQVFFKSMGDVTALRPPL